MSLDTSDTFQARHIGPRERDLPAMLDDRRRRFARCSWSTRRFPPPSASGGRSKLPPGESEHHYLTRLRSIAAENRVLRSFIGLGYYDTITPAVILRNVMENPGWYTPYTPYQAEIAQGRLESLLNFQTMVSDLTGDGGGERVAARRSDGRGGGDDAAAPRAREEGGGAHCSSSSDRVFPQTIDGAAVARRAARPGRARDRCG